MHSSLDEHLYEINYIYLPVQDIARFTFQCIVGCIFYSAGLITTPDTFCIYKNHEI
jgi:hypothetical protein